MNSHDSTLVVDDMMRDYDSDELDEDEAWRLLMEEDKEIETQIVQLVRRETLLTWVKVDLLDGSVMEVEAVVDTGSVLSFLSAQALRTCSPALLKQVESCAVRVHGISGEDIDVLGTLTLPCVVAERAVCHKFVVAEIVEPVLLGVDFMSLHRATWDWEVGDLIYQTELEALDTNACRVMTAEELPPSSTMCLKVKLGGQPPNGEPVYLEAFEYTPTGIVVEDVIDVACDGTARIIIENRTDFPFALPPGMLMGGWEPLTEPVTFANETYWEYPTQTLCGAVGSEKEMDPDLLAELQATLPPEQNDVSVADRAAMLRLFQKYRDVFALKSMELGRTDLVEHEIDVGDSSPIRVPPRRIPIHKMETVGKGSQ